MNKLNRSMQSEEIVLVNEKDKIIGARDKFKVHLDGDLHRAFSILVFNPNGELLIQKRNLNKYHSGGLWSNTCCSHQRCNEPLNKSIHRRLKEEMGFDCNLKEIFSFKYYIKFKNNLIENELDHVFIGFFEGEPIGNKKEVAEFKWISLKNLRTDMVINPNLYSHWFKIMIRDYWGEISNSLNFQELFCCQKNMYCGKCIKESDGKNKISMDIESDGRRYICPECGFSVDWNREKAKTLFSNHA